MCSLGLRELRQVQADDDSWRRAEPPTRRRAVDPEVGGDGQVPCASDEIPEPMVIALLRARRGRYPADDDGPIADAAQRLQEDAGGRRSARRELAQKVPNVDGDSSAQHTGRKPVEPLRFADRRQHQDCARGRTRRRLAGSRRHAERRIRDHPVRTTAIPRDGPHSAARAGRGRP